MKLTEKQTDLYFIVLSLITLPAVIYSYLKVIFFNDLYILLGSAVSADGFGFFPSNIDIAWETRPIGNRLLFYVLYKIGSPWYGDDFAFRMAVKVAVAVCILIICWYFALQVNKYISTPNKYAVFLLTALSLFTLHLIILLTTEFFAVLFALLTIALLLDTKKYTPYLAGCLMFFIITLKFVTVVFIPMAIIAWILLSNDINKPKIYRSVVGFICYCVAFIVMCGVWFKNFIPDLFLALMLHGRVSSVSLTTNLYQSFISGIDIWVVIPVLSVGGITGVLVLYDYLTTNKKTFGLLFISMWLCTGISLVIQAEWVTYHYTGLVLPSIISVILFTATNYKKHTTVVSTCILIALLVIFGFTCSIWTNTNGNYWDYKIKDTELMQTKFNITNQTAMLYLDVGISNYFIGVQNACRETYPLIIQRGYGLGLSNTTAYINAKECIMNYNGDYLIYDGSITDPEIKTKLNNEYIKVYYGSYKGINFPPSDLYQRNVSI